MKRMTAGLIALAMLIILYIPAFAEQKEQEVEVREAMANAVFLITWESGADAKVMLTDPSGKTHDAANMGAQYVKQGNTVAMFFQNPAVGKWKVRIEADSLGKVRLSIHEVTDLIELKKFEATTQDQYLFSFSWEAVQCEDNIQLTIFADEDDKGFDGLEVGNFYGSRTGNASLNLDRLSSGSYYFYIRARSANGVDDFMYTASQYTVINPNAPAEIPNVKVTTVNRSVRLQWEKPQSEVRAYKIMIFKKGETKPLFVEITEDTEQMEFFCPELEERDLEAAVAGVAYNELSGAYRRFAVDFGKQDALRAEVSFPDQEVLNAKRLVLPMKLEQGLTAGLYVNDTLMVDQIKESGQFAVELDDGANLVEVQVEDGEGNIRTYEKKLFVDTYPPQLNLYGSYDNLSTGQPNIPVIGEVEPNAGLLLNDKEVTLSENGVFIYDMPLKFGDNPFVLKAVDLAGNESVYYGNIRRYLGSGWIYTGILAILAVGSVVFLTVLFIRKKKQGGQGSKEGMQ